MGNCFRSEELIMEETTFLIDGKKLSALETRKLFESSSLGNREKICLSYIVNTDNKTIIDLGCLYGFFGKMLKIHFPKATIIAGDYVEENLKIARFLHPEISTAFKRLDAYDLEIESGTVDILVFQEVIEHLEGAALAIKEINRVLKVGGELILSTPTAYYWKDMWNAFKYELIRRYYKKNLTLSDSIYFTEHEWNRHIYCWTPSTLYTLLKVNGFEYVAHDYCKEGKGCVERTILRFFPFLSPCIIIKVKKTSEAPNKLI